VFLVTLSIVESSAIKPRPREICVDTNPEFVAGNLFNFNTSPSPLTIIGPRGNYADRATASCRRSYCQLLRIEGATCQCDGSLRSYSRISRSEPLLSLPSSSSVALTRLSGVTWRTRFPYLCPPGTGWPSCTTRHWVTFTSPLATRRATVEVF
jgi:hypothetical protein